MSVPLHEAILPGFRLLLHELRLPAGALVLDLASGQGDKLPLLRDALGPVALLALDLQPAALAAIPPQPLRGRIAADAHSLPLADACCDAVICFAALGAFAAPRRVLAEMRRVLRPGGVALLATAEQRWAQVVAWPPALAELLPPLPPAHADHVEPFEVDARAAGFRRVRSHALLLEQGEQPRAAALALLDLPGVLAHATVSLPAQLLAACQQAAADPAIDPVAIGILLWLEV